MSETPKTTESKGLWKILAFLEQVFCIVPLAVMTVLVFVAVICRYVFKSPIGWAEEVTLICMTWCVFGGASYAFKLGINVGVAFLTDKIGGKDNQKARHITTIVITILTIVFFAFLGYMGFLAFLNVLGKFTKAAHIPLWIPYVSIPVGCVMSILRLLEIILDNIKAMKNLNSVKETVSE